MPNCRNALPERPPRGYLLNVVKVVFIFHILLYRRRAPAVARSSAPHASAPPRPARRVLCCRASAAAPARLGPMHHLLRHPGTKNKLQTTVNP